MRLRRFEAATVGEALAAVRAELGPEAVILHARAADPGGPERRVEVMAAVDTTPAPAGRACREYQGAAHPGLHEALPREWPAETLGDDRLDDMYRMLLDLREARGEQRRTGCSPAVRELSRHELPARVVQRLVAGLAQGPGRRQPSRSAVHTALARAFRVRGHLIPGRRRRIVALVGPTGVGKTTTLAKLAGQLRQAGASLNIVSLDTYRIGAVAQMQIYAELLGVPFHVARSAAELRAAVAAEADAEVVLVDSTGRSPSHRDGIAALKEVLAGLPHLEVHLAVSATTKGTDVEDILRRFRPLGYQYLVVTKLDEARTAGPVLGAALERELPISYVTTGQEVPNDLEPATARGLAGLLLPDRPRTLARA